MPSSSTSGMAWNRSTWATRLLPPYPLSVFCPHLLWRPGIVSSLCIWLAFASCIFPFLFLFFSFFLCSNLLAIEEGTVGLCTSIDSKEKTTVGEESACGWSAIVSGPELLYHCAQLVRAIIWEKEWLRKWCDSLRFQCIIVNSRRSVLGNDYCWHE